MLSIVAIVLSVVALSVGLPTTYPGYGSGYNTGYSTGYNSQPLYYYYYPSYNQYPVGYVPNYASASPYSPFTSTGLTPAVTTTGFGSPVTGTGFQQQIPTTAGFAPTLTTAGYTFGASADSPNPTTVPTFQAVAEFFQNLFNIIRPKPVTGTGSGTTPSDTTSDDATGTSYFQPQTNTLYFRPGSTRYSYSYPTVQQQQQQQQTYSGNSFYPYPSSYNSYYYPRYQANQALTV